LSKQEGLLPLADASYKLALETFSRPTGEHRSSHGILPFTHGTNQQRPWGRLTPTHKRKTQLNNKQQAEN
jgi:hypothetical protein